MAALSRRTMLAAVGVMPIAASSAAAVCQLEQEDSELIAAVGEWRRLRAIEADMLTRLWRLEQQLGEALPEMPEALFVAPHDWTIGVALPAAGRRILFTDQDVFRLRSSTIMMRVCDPKASNWGEIAPCPRAKARVDEICAAWDSREADVKALKDFLGLPEAGERFGEASRASKAAFAVVANAKARTLTGAAAKAQGFLYYLSTMDGEECLRGDAEDIEIDMLLSIVRNVAALGGRA